MEDLTIGYYGFTIIMMAVVFDAGIVLGLILNENKEKLIATLDKWTDSFLEWIMNAFTTVKERRTKSK